MGLSISAHVAFFVTASPCLFYRSLLFNIMPFRSVSNIVAISVSVVVYLFFLTIQQSKQQRRGCKNTEKTHSDCKNIVIEGIMFSFINYIEKTKNLKK